MTDKITIRKYGDGYEMHFEGGNDNYSVPEEALDDLDDKHVPSEVGDKVTFHGKYDSDEKTFDVIESHGDEETESNLDDFGVDI